MTDLDAGLQSPILHVKMTVQKGRREAGAWTKFRLLMWKNFVQQWRHPLQTATELLLPVLTMALVLLLRWQIEPVVSERITYPPIRADSLNYSLNVMAGMNITGLSIAYSPKSDILDRVLRNASLKLVRRNIAELIDYILPNLPGNFTLPDNITLPPDLLLDPALVIQYILERISVIPYENSDELRSIYIQEEATRNVIAAVEFSDELYGATSLTNNLSYALRFPERPRLNSFYRVGGRSWRTDKVFPVFDMPGPRFPYSWEGGNDPGYVNEMFIALQQVISTELISSFTGNFEALNQFEIYINRYPHPEYVMDLAIETLQALFPMFMMLSFSYTAVNIVRAVTVEKEMQLKETMKIMGLPTWLHWTAWFCKQFLYLILTTLLIIILLKVNWFETDDGFRDYAVFTNTPWTILLFFIMLYLSCTIFFCFMISGFFSKASTAALFTGVIWFLTYIPAFLLALDVTMSPAVQAFTCISINSAMSYGFQLMIARESTGGLQWSTFFSAPGTDNPRFLFGHVVLMMVLNCVLYMLIALYLEQVLPGPYGTPKPWYFLVQKRYWCTPSNQIGNYIDKNKDVQNITKEKDPVGHNVGVKISNLTKMYGQNVVVNELNLNIYDDQITVLLGHNGAGKSTTIAMLTGNLEITSGSVSVAGCDISSQVREARSHIGFCPQHNVLFNDLNVHEHLEFFARLKGFSGKELQEDIDTLIDKLELQDKRYYKAGGLSGGQKRRLAVGIALSGAAKVILLDEPTSGMDPASRRALWDLLQKEKKGRSIILTTHFMDEADILGDRVAIMAQGGLQCVGSPYFLKKHYGVGYNLVVVKGSGFNFDACTEVIKKHIPDSIVGEDRGSEVTYRLKNEYSHVFETMLQNLEQNITEIKFVNYGLVASTLEDVFMSVGSDTNYRDTEDGSASNATESVSEEGPSEYESSSYQLDGGDQNNTGCSLWWQHVTAIWLKLWLVWTRSWGMLLLQLLVPAILVNATLGFMRYVWSFSESIMRRELTLREGFSGTETLLNYNGTLSTSIGYLATMAYQGIFAASDNPTMKLSVVNESYLGDYYLDRNADSVTMGQARESMLIGATFEDVSSTAWFSNFGYHDVAMSLSAIHNAILKSMNPNATITVYNYPLEAHYENQSNMEMMVQMLSMQLAVGIGNSVGIVSAVFIMFYIKERISRAKLLQKAAGIRPLTMWLSAALFDCVWFLIINLNIVISCAAFQVIGLSTAEELGRMYVLLIVYSAAMLPINYICSYLFKGPAVGFVVMFFINVLLGMMGPQIVEALWHPALDTKLVADIMDYVLQFFPLYSLVTSIRLLNKDGLLRWSCLAACDYMQIISPGLQECTMETLCENFSSQCCVREHPYWDWEEPGVMRYLVSMLFTCTVVWLLFMVLEYRLPQKIFHRTRQPPAVDPQSLDSDVVAEAEHVQRLSAETKAHTLVANSLCKYYGKHLAVNQVSFSVSDAECFGLLGVNGAGKTTTFKMLMGDESISSGDAFVSGHSVKTNITTVYENIGYCPQFDAVFGELTGRETLRIFCKLRGLRAQAARAQAGAVARALGFTQHLDKRVDQYSGGNKRKLSTAIALLGRTRLIFVDEPTTGVDPAAKRQVWSAIRAARRAGRGVVLTSHSMEECEALCSRLTVMVNGQFQCLGSPQHLKNKFSQGFTLTVKLKLDDNTAANEATTEAVKLYISSNFLDANIMEEYQGLITYYLPDRSLPWSRMFGLMEAAKRDLSLENYTISQTTLEQIFLQFTKYQRENK